MKIICVGRNYAKHAEELKNEVPPEPVIFMKPKNALLQNNHPFYYPEFTDNLHYECELVLADIRRTGSTFRKDLPDKYYDQHFRMGSISRPETSRRNRNRRACPGKLQNRSIIPLWWISLFPLLRSKQI